MNTFKSFFKPLFATRKPLDEFKECWSTIQSEHLSLANEKKNNASATAKLRPNSTLESNLRRLLQIIIKESKQQKKREDGMYETTGPCLEFLLNQRILETLCMMGLSDRPVGLMAVVMQAFYTLLKHIKEPLLPHMSVHKPVCQLIYVCGEIIKDMGRKPNLDQIKKTLVALIAVVWKKIEQDPTQLDFFLESGDKLTIFSALLPHLHAPGQIGDHARQSILRAVDLDSPQLHEFINRHTSLAKTLANGLTTGYSALKVAATFATVTQSPNAGDDVASGSANNNLALSEETLFFRMSYCDQLLHALCFQATADGRWQVRGAGGTDHAAAVRAQCVDRIQKQFIQLLYASLLETSEAVAAAATNQVRAMIEYLAAWTRQSQHQHCSPMLSLISDSILGCGCLPQLSPLTPPAAVGGATAKALKPAVATAAAKTGDGLQAQRQVLRNTIVHRIDSVAEVLTVASLQLFGSLLDTDDVSIINSLLPKQYHTFPAAAEAEPKSALRKTAKDVFALFKGPYTVWPDTAHPSFVPYLADAEELLIHTMLRSCDSRSLSLKAADPASATIPPATAAAAVAPAPTATPAAAAAADADAATVSPAPTATPAAAASGGHDKGELGVFLNLLFNKLENALDNTQAENIELTGVLSKLCQFPDEVVNRHFFNLSELKPYVRTAEDLFASSTPQTTRSFPSVLQQLWSDAQERADRVPDFRQKLTRTRSLMGVPGADGKVDTHAETLDEDGSSFDSNFGQQRLLEAYVVLEEFIKELAAIVQARENVAKVQCEVDLSMQTSLKPDPAPRQQDSTAATPPMVPPRLEDPKKST